MKLVAINKQTKQYLINIPGVQKENIAISVNDRLVSISLKEEVKLLEGWAHFKQEGVQRIMKAPLFNGPFFHGLDDVLKEIEGYLNDQKLQFHIGYSPNVDEVSAKLVDGQLWLTIPELKSGKDIVVE